MSKDARRKSRNRDEKKGFRRKSGRTPRDEVRDKRDVEVRDFANFCFCPTPDLDASDVCRKCNTQWS